MQNAGMPAITIRDVPPEARDRLAALAKAQGQSLQQFLRSELIQLSARHSNAELIARIRRRVERSGSTVTTEGILESIRDGRDR